MNVLVQRHSLRRASRARALALVVAGVALACGAAPAARVRAAHAAGTARTRSPASCSRRASSADGPAPRRRPVLRRVRQAPPERHRARRRRLPLQGAGARRRRRRQVLLLPVRPLARLGRAGRRLDEDLRVGRPLLLRQGARRGRRLGHELQRQRPDGGPVADPGHPAGVRAATSGPGTGGVITRNDVPADPSCIAKAEKQPPYAKPRRRGPQAGVRVLAATRGGLGGGARSATRARACARRSASPSRVHRGFLRYCLARRRQAARRPGRATAAATAARSTRRRRTADGPDDARGLAVHGVQRGDRARALRAGGAAPAAALHARAPPRLRARPRGELAGCATAACASSRCTTRAAIATPSRAARLAAPLAVGAGPLHRAARRRGRIHERLHDPQAGGRRGRVRGALPGAMRFMTGPLGQRAGCAHPPPHAPGSGGKGGYGHRHRTQEEVYYADLRHAADGSRRRSSRATVR